MFGLPKSKRIFEYETDNKQLSRRFKYRYELIPFPRDDSGMKLFRQFLSDIEEQLPLAEKSGLATKSLSERIYYATDGTIAHVMTLIRKGTTLAIKQDLERLDLEILNTVYERHLKHEKPFKYTEPFLVKKLDFEASYALDLSKQINQNNRNGNLRSILHS